MLAAHAGTLETLEAAGEEELTDLRGVGPEIAASVTAFFRQQENRRIVAALLANGVRAVPESADASTGAGPLAGLSFVFTGTLDSLSREQAQDLVARAGGRSVASVSRATSYVVVGSDPGSKALQAEKLGVPRLSDSGFLALLKEKGIVMKKPASLTIAMAASEALPYSKSGGLADVAGALPGHLARLGHRVLLFVPYYRETRARFPHLPRAHEPLDLPFPGHDVRVEMLRHEPAPGVSVLLVREDAAFDRPHLYGSPDGDYWDNAGRYALFCRAVLASLQALGEHPDVIHAHDWQTALLPLYLRQRPDFAGPLAGTPSLLTVHNLAYQGVFPASAMAYTGIPEHLFHPHGIEYYGRINLLKGGLLYADAITTVSPRYSEEIRTPAFGEGLDGVLRERAAVIHGILNGVDHEQWNPETDPFLPARYSAVAPEGKARCKEALLQAFGLEGGPGGPAVRDDLAPRGPERVSI